jgi:methyltransferase (TIGR00027 family)
MPDPAQIRNISDTALWVATYRAGESARPDAIFRDPLAAKLAGARGAQMAAGLKFAEKNAWSYIARTWLVDRFVEQQVKDGVDTIINLAAGLDTRPYRMELPPALRWVEIDLPDLFAYKQEIIGKEQPRCRVERIACDLADVTERRALFARLGGEAKRAALITEGLIIYFTAEAVQAFARDLAAQRSFRVWATDLTSPKLLHMIQKAMGKHLEAADAPLRFAPPEGPAFFRPLGWEPREAHSLLHTAAQLKRLSFFMRLLSKLPDSQGKQPGKPWGGVVVLENQQR